MIDKIKQNAQLVVSTTENQLCKKVIFDFESGSSLNRNEEFRRKLKINFFLIIALGMFFKIGNAQKPELYTQSGHTTFINSTVLSPDGRTIASASSDDSIKLWSAETGRELKTLFGHTKDVRSVAFSPDGKFLASASFDKTVNLWNAENGQRLGVFYGHKDLVTSAIFSSDGQIIISAGAGEIKLWDTKTQQERATFSEPKSLFTSIALSPNGQILASACGDGSIKLWDIKTEKIIQTIQGHKEWANAVVFSSDGTTIASASFDKTVKLWNVKTGKELIVLKGHTDRVYSVAFSPDGKIIVTGSGDGIIKLWNKQSGQELHSFSSHSGIVTSVWFSRNGKIIGSGGGDAVIKLWDATTRKELKILRGYADFIASVWFSPKGKIIAASGFDGTIRLWNTEPGRELQILHGHSQNLSSLMFSEDEQIVVSAGNDNTIKVWNVKTGKMIESFERDKPETEEKISNIMPDFDPDGFPQALVSPNGRFEIKKGETPGDLYDDDGRFDLYDNNGKLVCSLIAFNRDDWAVITPEGFFDGTPNAWKLLAWRLSPQLYDIVPIEAFFKEFYSPGLLQDIFAGNEIEPPTQDLSKIDIRQPLVKILGIDGKVVDSSALLPEAVSADKKSVKVKIEITDNNSEPRSGIAKDTSSDAQDVRLFRNGSLVKLWNGNAFKLAEKDGCKQIAATKDSPRKAICETEVQISAGKNELTAYGFNYQDVKSADSLAVVNGADSLKRDGTLYVLAVGVNKYANADYNLNYAVKDVQEIGKTLQDRQTKLGNLKQYAKTEIVTLTDELATKENILYAFKRFAEGDKTALPVNLPDKLKAELSKIKQTQPEDALLIYFAGHGVSQKERFYLLPHNFTGDAAKLVEQSVSDLELNDYLEKVDAGKLLMVIDACQSGAALGGKNDGKAPMNSKGFAQLAYDKGMLILTAAQSQQAALEAVRIGDKTIENGLLTYALLQAFSKPEADKDGNKQLWEREWFDFAVNEVPLFQREAMKQREVDLQNKNPQTKDRSGIYYVNGEEKKKAEERGVQTPRVFYRRETEIKPLILSNP